MGAMTGTEMVGDRAVGIVTTRVLDGIVTTRAVRDGTTTTRAGRLEAGTADLNHP
jgi:hypothetical protein